jgi:hypothetical protein
MRLPEIGIPVMRTTRLRCVLLRKATEHEWSFSGVSP